MYLEEVTTVNYKDGEATAYTNIGTKCGQYKLCLLYTSLPVSVTYIRPGVNREMQKRTALRRFFFTVVYPGGGGFKRRGPEPPPLSLQGDRILKERGKFEIPLSSVSYTHLDVYKRQVLP